MSGDGLHVAVVGATGLVGRDLLEALADAELPVAEVRAVASPASRLETVAFRDGSLTVHAFGDDPVALLDGVDVAFFATPPEVTRRHAPAVAEEGIAVVDVGAALADRAPVLVPASGAGDWEAFAEVRVACSPSAPAVLLATLLGALSGLEPSAARATVLLGAGSAGKAGIEELSGQVIALFGQREPPRRVFATGLAFDLVGQVGDVGPGGWTEAEERVAQEVAAALGAGAPRTAVTLVLVPVFTGVAAALQVDLDAPDAGPEAVRAALEAVPRVELLDPVPGPRRLAGRAAICAGRLRADPLGEGVHLWATADNVRAGATANAVDIAVHLWREGLL